MRYLPLLLLTFLGTCVSAQQNTPSGKSGNALREVVTKTIEDTYAYTPGKELAVEGEKAEIFVETWDKPKIHVKIVMTARHARLETAKKDLENLEYLREVAGQKIFLRNRLVDKNLKSSSELTIHYYITLPEECPVYLKSYFGGTTISNLRNQLRINGEYSAININNVQGLLDIRSRFGDITGERIDGNVVINSRRSDISLFNIGGNFTINAQYGELKLSPNLRMRDLKITADKSDVYLYEPVGGEGMAYEISLNNGEMKLPDGRKVLELERSEEVRRVAIRPNRERIGTITASVSFGDLYLDKQVRELERTRF
ncbi:DUF4097 family beta strand repeat-containing protein [Neolewinella lacunae]|uniref:DUF4097 family beta strand repeat protein n=1 Tax=Neolewinella lacunae TaxID=1517758 RepID=A0A923T7K5_9BACT|nr:DUF4097 family beta strand repeat-containing protein [Neolewinella lacunae]MBC6993641.1 DUF4097 family beta strand repeat protein [Neolewinella lacunae]MDN3634731.1 DUF4097 family beta strand repeat-containing protein [Neolewinella lacunae]